MKKQSFFRRLGFFCLVLFSASFLTLLVSSTAGFTITAKASEVSEEPVSKAKLNVSKKSLVKEDTYTLKVYNLTDGQRVVFKSESTDIASVAAKKNDKEAVVTGLSVGKSTITVSVKEGLKTVQTMTCDIIVTPPAKTVKFVNLTITVKVGDVINLKDVTDVKPLNTAEVPVFSVADDSIIVLTSTSMSVKAKQTGETTITAVIANGSFDTCTIIVIENKVPEEAPTGTPPAQQSVPAR